MPLLLRCLPRLLPRYDDRKLETNLKLATIRLSLVSKKHSNKILTTRRAIERELTTRTGQSDSKLRLYCDTLIRDENTLAVLDILSALCQDLLQQFPLKRRCSAKSLMKDNNRLLTNVVTLVYASTRIPIDIPELSAIQKQIRARFGSKFFKSAQENQTNKARVDVVCKLNSAVSEELVSSVVETLKKECGRFPPKKTCAYMKKAESRRINKPGRNGERDSAAPPANDSFTNPPPMNPNYKGDSDCAEKSNSDSSLLRQPLKSLNLDGNRNAPPMNPDYKNANGFPAKSNSAPLPSRQSLQSMPLQSKNRHKPSTSEFNNQQPLAVLRPPKDHKSVLASGAKYRHGSLCSMSPSLPIYLFCPNPYLEIAFDVRTKNPVYTLERLVPTSTIPSFGGKQRLQFYEESRLPEEYRSKLQHYRNSGYDRGHMAPAADFPSDRKSTFTMVNICPQVHSVNNSIWKRLEHWCRTVPEQQISEDEGATFVVTGPLWLPVDKSDRKTEFNYPAIGTGDDDEDVVHVPTHFFKVVAVIAADEILKFACFMVPNNNSFDESSKNLVLRDFVVHWSFLERVTGLQFFPNATNADWKDAAHAATNQVLLCLQSKPKEDVVLHHNTVRVHHLLE